MCKYIRALDFENLRHSSMLVEIANTFTDDCLQNQTIKGLPVRGDFSPTGLGLDRDMGTVNCTYYPIDPCISRLLIMQIYTTTKFCKLTCFFVEGVQRCALSTSCRKPDERFSDFLTEVDDIEGLVESIQRSLMCNTKPVSEIPDGLGCRENWSSKNIYLHLAV